MLVEFGSILLHRWGYPLNNGPKLTVGEPIKLKKVTFVVIYCKAKEFENKI